MLIFVQIFELIISGAYPLVMHTYGSASSRGAVPALELDLVHAPDVVSPRERLVLQLLALWPLPSGLQGLGGHCERSATSRDNTAHGGDMAEVTGGGEAAGELQVVREEDVPDGHGFSCEKTSGAGKK